MSSPHGPLLLSLLVLGGSLQPAASAEITACVIAGLQGNPSYYSTATTATRLKCELNAADYYPTLNELYQQGFRLIQVIGGDHAMSLGNGGPSPLYLLERETSPASPAAAPEQPPPRDRPSGKK